MKVSLHTSALAAHAHEQVVLPWLKNAAHSAAGTRLATAVLVPLRADAYHLKALALSAGLGLCGVHFLTPGDLRDRLSRHAGLASRVPPREHLRLLLATAAERVAERRGEGADAIADAPDQLLKAIDLIGGGGWNFAEAGPVGLRPAVAEFQRLLKGAGFSTVHDADRALLTAARSAPPFFAEVLVTGFNALHWPQWPLLEAAVRVSESATVCLTDPRPEGEDLDAAWVGTWEETFGAAQPVAADFASPLTELLRLPETAGERAQREAEPAREVTFLVGHDTAEQARAVVTQALQFLADPACERLGVLFPAAGALSRRVAALLAELDVPHHDGLAHHAPGPLEDAAWPAWLALQESPRLPALLAFLRARPEELFAGLPLAEVEDALPRIFQELLFDDLQIVAEYLAQHPRKRHAPALSGALRDLVFLPERATLEHFITASLAVFRDFGWDARTAELVSLATDWKNAPELQISRRSWLRWLGETLVSWRAERAPAGAHPYSRLHLLPYAQAEAQAWTHLIATDLNEGHWPPTLEEAGFLGEEEIDQLNRRLAALNTRVSGQGRQGEGHIAVQPGKAFCLGPAQRRMLVVRQFLNTLESTTVAVAASASLYEESAPDRRLNPSDFFNRLHFGTRGRAVSQDAMSALRTETTRWLDASGLWKTAAPDFTAVQPTRTAYHARRAADSAFDEFSFALRAPLPQPIRLTATAWENALKSPALVWMNCLLGVGPGESGDETPWSLATGQWVHQWLAAISDAPERGDFAPLPAPAELHARVLARARAFRDRITGVLAQSGRTPPDWWLSAWEQALRLATQLATRVAEVTGPTHLATERTLGDTAIALGAGAALHVRGRIDLILARAAPTGAGWPENAWIVDYKTGNRKALTPTRLAGGEGLQLALYALALGQLGASGAGVSLLTPALALDTPQLTPAGLAEQERLWRGLHAMQERGVFGQRGALRDEWSFRGDYPLATLAIDEEILAEKWERTHPDFADEASEEPV